MINSSHFFDLYKGKASDILRDRNAFLSLYSSTIIAVFIPLVYSTKLVINIEQSRLASVVLVSVGVLIYSFCEIKYREYRYGYMLTAIRQICDSINPKERPKTYDELCDIIQGRTLFMREHIMMILKKDIFPPLPERLPEQ